MAWVEWGLGWHKNEILKKLKYCSKNFFLKNKIKLIGVAQGGGERGEGGGRWRKK